MGHCCPDCVRHDADVDIHERHFVAQPLPAIRWEGLVFTVELQMIKGRLLSRIRGLDLAREGAG